MINTPIKFFVIYGRAHSIIGKHMLNKCANFHFSKKYILIRHRHHIEKGIMDIDRAQNAADSNGCNNDYENRTSNSYLRMTIIIIMSLIAVSASAAEDIRPLTSYDIAGDDYLDALPIMQHALEYYNSETQLVEINRFSHEGLRLADGERKIYVISNSKGIDTIAFICYNSEIQGFDFLQGGKWENCKFRLKIAKFPEGIPFKVDPVK